MPLHNKELFRDVTVEYHLPPATCYPNSNGIFNRSSAIYQVGKKTLLCYSCLAAGRDVTHQFIAA